MNARARLLTSRRLDLQNQTASPHHLPSRPLRPPVRCVHYRKSVLNPGSPIKALTSPPYPSRERVYFPRRSCTFPYTIRMVKKIVSLRSCYICDYRGTKRSGTPRPSYLRISLHTFANLTRNGTSMPRIIHPAMVDSPTTILTTRP